MLPNKQPSPQTAAKYHRFIDKWVKSAVTICTHQSRWMSNTGIRLTIGSNQSSQSESLSLLDAEQSALSAHWIGCLLLKIWGGPCLFQGRLDSVNRQLKRQQQTNLNWLKIAVTHSLAQQSHNHNNHCTITHTYTPVYTAHTWWKHTKITTTKQNKRWIKCPWQLAEVKASKVKSSYMTIHVCNVHVTDLGDEKSHFWI